MTATPPACRRIVGRALRGYREDHGWLLDDAARVLECDKSKISRIETGDRGIRGKELRQLLTEYGANEETCDAMAGIADPRGARGWWKTFAGILPDAWRDRFALESAATTILTYEAQRVPEILQSRPYAEALAQADPALKDDEARDSAVRATLGLQQAWAESKTDIHVILGEAALLQTVGGADVMEDQLGTLAAICGDSGRVTIQVLPFAQDAHAAQWAGSLTMLGFEWADPGAVLMGSATGGLCLDDDGDISAARRVLDRLKAIALPPARSALVLRGLKMA
jgi:transcriptional regulator with XRE-family HTH domain